MFWSCLVHIVFALSGMSSFVISCSANESDGLTLQAFKAQVNDDPLGALSNWNKSFHYCDWYGVTCSRRHPNRVKELNITSQKLGEYGMGRPVSIQGDVYSYGILLLEMVTGKRPTDDMFQNGHNLHNFAKGLLPEQVMIIADPMILLDGHEDAVTIINHSESRAILHPDRQFRMLECLLSLTRLGATCSSESPIERMNMKDVLTELHLIKDHFQCI